MPLPPPTTQENFRDSSSTSGLPDALGTVTVAGQVHWAGEVNYAMYGRFYRVAYDRMADEMTATGETPPSPDDYFRRLDAAIRGYRTVKNGVNIITDSEQPELRSSGAGIPGRIAWAEAGFYGDLHADDYQLNGNRAGDSRSILPSTTTYQGVLNFTVRQVVGPRLVDIDIWSNSDGTAKVGPQSKVPPITGFDYRQALDKNYGRR